MPLYRRLAGVALLLGALAVLGPTSAASAQVDGYEWIIDRFSTAITVEPDGTLRVVEDIAVDFRGADKHGIYRVIPVRYELSPADTRLELPAGRPAGDFLRVIEIDDVSVTSTAPSDLVIEEPSRFAGRELSLRIGDEDRTVSGPQTYRISYTVRGALNAFEAHAELYWNATGSEWEVPIRRARATVTAPEITQVGCFRGPVGATSVCEEATVDGDTATFTATRLQPGEGLTFVAAMPSGAVAVPAPILAEKWSPGRALTGSPGAVPAGAAIGLLGAGALGLLAFRHGRDRVTRGGVGVDGRLDAAHSQRRPLFSSRVTPVEFRPPDGLRPAQAGVLVDERVDPVDISATIVDLAVRGHLRIVELAEKRLWGSKTDWRLERLSSDDPLAPFEQRLLSGLFALRTEVELSELKGTFAEDYKAVQSQLYDDAKQRGWFPRRPDHVRNGWLGLGIVLLLLGTGAFVLAGLFTTWAAALLPLPLLGIAVLVAHRWMPHRTARGSQALDKVLGFRQFIVNAEAGRAEYAEHENLFVAYLPYAVVFGAVDKWASTFAGLGAATATAGVGTWYVGAYPGSFDAARFSGALTDFSGVVGSSLPTAPASSGGSGFSGGSGGGFGGGGGGSW